MFRLSPAPSGWWRLAPAWVASILLFGIVPFPVGYLATAAPNLIVQGHPVSVPAPHALSASPVVHGQPLPRSHVAPRFHGLNQGAYRPSGVTPASWGGAKLPPGAPIPKNLVHPADNWSNDGINWSALAKFCYGVWPDAGGQSQYLANCYGHDEPGFDPYSSLPGSGGNVTWNITLPTGRNATEVQSALYSAIWFGMVLTDPYAWMDECFLELQFYPDSSWGTGGISAGNWVGAAVAWQIEAASGAENPCFYAQLTTSGSGTYFNMNQGDVIQVTMLGWIGSPYGENLTIRDLTTRQSSFVNLYNSALSYPLDPSYSTSSFPNALQWTPGGELPVSFAFETGHSNANFPNTNQYGGCSSGPPPPTPTNPSVPCPSYDPGSWANDTVTPWLIPPPVFYNAQTRERATQAGFTQDWAGILFIDGLSNGACNGRDGSAWCSYPWWSFSCRSGAIEYGATDYPGVTSDFGKYDEFSRAYLINADGLGYYPPANYSVPTCGAPTYNVTISALGGGGTGTVRLLGTATHGSTNVTALTAGDFSLDAAPDPGYRFLDWVVTGGARVDFTTGPWAALNVTGNATVTAVFGAMTPGTVTVRFSDLHGHGWQAVEPGFLIGPASSTRTTGVNGSLTLLPGIYSIIAYPKIGYNFTSWQSNNSGAAVAAPGFPFTWLVVTGNRSLVELNVSFVASPLNSSIAVTILVGSGTLKLEGQVISSGGGLFPTPVGTYSIVATPAAGESVTAISFSGISVGIDQHPATNVTVEGGPASVYVSFGPAVTIATSGGDGNVSINLAPPVGNQSVVPFPNQFAPTEYALYATIPGGHVFSHWSVANPAALWVLKSSSAVTDVWVNSSSTITAHYASAPAVYPLQIRMTPTGAGTVSIDGGTWTSASPLFLNLSPGIHLLDVAPGPAYTVSWSSSGSTTHAAAPFGFLPGSQLLAVGTGIAWLNGSFTRPGGTYFPVSIVASDASGTVKIDGLTRPNGGTIVLTPGTHSVSATFPAPLSFTGWEATSNLTLTHSGFSETLNVQGSGTVYAISTWPIALSVSANVTRGRAPLTVGFSVGVIGAQAPWAIVWNFHDGSPTANGTSVSHTFLTQGFYNVTTSIVDSLGATGASTTYVQVLPPALTALAVSNLTSGIAPLTVGFVGHGSSGVPPYSFNWTFNDGTPAVAALNATHTFVDPGTYLVNFYVNDSARQHSLSQITVKAFSSLTASLTAAPLNGTVPLVVKFQGFAHRGTAPYTYAWSFGDGFQGSGSNVTYTYRVAGVYNVTLLVGDRFGSVANATASVNATRLFTQLSVALVESTTNVTLGKTLSVRATATGGTGPYTYQWTGLPPGCSSTAASWTCTPMAAGNYTITVNVNDSTAPPEMSSAGVGIVVYQAPSGTPGGTGPNHITSAGSLSWVPYVAVAALIVGGLGALLLLRRRPPPSEGPPDDAEDPAR